MQEGLSSEMKHIHAASRKQVAGIYIGAVLWHSLLAYGSLRINLRYTGFIGGADVDVSSLPLLSRWTIQFPWWPFLFLIGSLLGLAMAVRVRRQSVTAHHQALLAGFWIESILIAASVVGYVMPLGAAAPLF